MLCIIRKKSFTLLQRVAWQSSFQAGRAEHTTNHTFKQGEAALNYDTLLPELLYKAPEKADGFSSSIYLQYRYATSAMIRLRKRRPSDRMTAFLDKWHKHTKVPCSVFLSFLSQRFVVRILLFLAFPELPA